MTQLRSIVRSKKIIIEFDKGLKSARAYKESGDQIVTDTLFWFAWAAFHPETEVYTS